MTLQKVKLMAQTPSTMLPLGTKAYDFKLLDTRSDQMLSLTALKAKNATVIMFICNHCPYVIHIISKLVETAKAYQEKGIAFVAISSNDVDDYPQDGPEKMKAFAEHYRFSFPYLYDETQSVAKEYQAACTPDLYVFDDSLACVYRGRFDEATPANGKEVNGKELRAALDAILQKEKVNPDQKASVGCNIKWKK
jgi:peroxiredoxin